MPGIWTGCHDHLKMNFRVVDDQDKLLDYGRDLKKLQLKYTVKAEDSFDQIAADELNYTGCIQWAFDDLPDTYQFIQNGQTFVGFPAIVDEGDSVGVRIFDTAQKAELQHQAGLMRLFQLQLRKECTYIIKNMPQSPTAELTYNRLPKHPIISTFPGGNLEASPSYKEDMLYLILYSVFVDGRALRTQQAFEQSLQQHKSEWSASQMKQEKPRWKSWNSMARSKPSYNASMPMIHWQRTLMSNWIF